MKKEGKEKGKKVRIKFSNFERENVFVLKYLLNLNVKYKFTEKGSRL